MQCCFNEDRHIRIFEGLRMSNFGEVLAHFKKVEDAENIVPLIEDAELRNALVAWKGVMIRFKPPQTCPHSDEPSKWNWLWEQISYDRVEFGVVAGLRAQDVGRILTRMIGLRLIYPDGTVNNFARQYLASILLRILEKNQKTVPTKRDSGKTAPD